jgi:cytochrome c peroxidase
LKKQIIILLAIAIIATSLLLDGCKKGDVKNGTTPKAFNIPKGWPQPTTDIFKDNPLTEEGFALGKRLFYDGMLSKDGNASCASCHQQFAAFATFDHNFSHGVNNTFTTRNSPGLFNVAWMTLLHWDGAINHIEVQPLAPLTAPNEMGETIDNVLNKLRNDANYPGQFKAAFGSSDISSQRMLKALAQFVGAIISADSKYDKVQRGQASFTTAEQRGYNVFTAKCAGCHKEPLFTDNSFRNNGLYVDPFLKDYGRYAITNNKSDSLKFKVPSLRNVQLTYPYMHDGRMNSLGEVIDHYRTGINTTQPTLDPLLKNRIAISNTEKNDLIFFLYTLTDTTFTKSPEFSR